jgi:V/A-type H+/Na+-transporting ATPase subunit F
MKFYVISDNVDTTTGLRLAGIDGVVVHEQQEVINALTAACEDTDIGIVLITEKLVSLCQSLIDETKLNRRRPLIVEIPDRHGFGRSNDSIARYVREAIGLKI